MEELKVFNPSGKMSMMNVPAPRLKDLHGKKVGLLWNGVFRGAETFAYLQKALKERIPDIDVRSYDELPVGFSDVRTIGELIKKKGLDAVISGNGG